MACETAKPSTSHADQFISHFTTPVSNASSSKAKQKAGVSRQSTLDKFVAKAGPQRPQSQNRGPELRDQDGVEGDERVSCIDIDAEAAKTWTYPGYFSQFFLIFTFILWLGKWVSRFLGNIKEMGFEEPIQSSGLFFWVI